MHNRSNRVRSLVAPILVAVALLVGTVPAAASAQQITPPDEQYENGLLAAGAGGGQDPGTTVATDPASGDELPFTGLDVATIALIGVGLVGTGLIVRRVSRSRSDHAV